MVPLAPSHPIMTRFFDPLELCLRLLTGIFIILLIAALSEQVIHRYLFGGSWTLMGFVIPLCFVWSSMLGSAIAVRRGAHFSADMLSRFFPPRGRLVFRYLQVASTVAVSAILIISGIGFVQLGMAKSDPFTGFSMAYTYAALPAGGLFMLLFAVELFVRGGEPLFDKDLQAET